MNSTLFPVQEIGSLPKAPWLISYLRGKPVDPSEIEHLSKWSSIIGFEAASEVQDMLSKSKTPERESRIRSLASLFGLRFLESIGLDYVYDGEANRIEMYEHSIRNSYGFEFYGHVRSFDNRYYRKAACVSKAGFRQAYHLDEFTYILQHAKRRTKIPITGPYTLAEWSFNEYYQKKLKGRPDLRKLKLEAKRDLLLDISKEIIRPNIQALVSVGASWIQIDEPAITTKPEEIPFFVEAYNECTTGIECKFSIHLCYSDYRLLYPHILELKNCSHLALEFANRDAKGDAYEQLNLLNEFADKREVGLGVADVHGNHVEEPSLVEKRAIRAARILGNPERIYLNPDCGLRTRTWEISHRKLCNIVEGAELARRELAKS